MGAPPSDARFAFLREPDLYDLAYRVALRIVRDPVFAEDVRQGAYLVAMQLVLGDRGPRPGMERGWMCRVTKNHAYAELRRRKGEEPPLDDDDAPDIPVADQRTLLEQQQELERLYDVAQETVAKHPEHARELRASDGRTKEGAKEGGAKDAAARKRKERSRAFLASAISAAMAAAIAILWMRHRPAGNQPGLPVWTDTTLAAAGHELAHKSCAAHQWVTCLEDLDQVKRLDATKFGPVEQSAWKAAVAGIRGEAFAACEQSQWMTCLERLDSAGRYDPDGESDPSVQLARSHAQKALQGSAAPSPKWVPDAKDVPPRRR